MIVKLPTLGLVCPFPLVEAKEAMAKLNKGDGLKLQQVRGGGFAISLKAL